MTFLIESTNLIPELPEFLRRSDLSKPNRSRRRNDRRVKLTNKRLPCENSPPKGKKFLGSERVTVMLKDEAPRIGSGYRSTWAKVGRKWVWLCDSLGNTAKLNVATYRRLKI